MLFFPAMLPGGNATRSQLVFTKTDCHVFVRASHCAEGLKYAETFVARNAALAASVTWLRTCNAVGRGV